MVAGEMGEEMPLYMDCHLDERDPTPQDAGGEAAMRGLEAPIRLYEVIVSPARA